MDFEFPNEEATVGYTAEQIEKMKHGYLHVARDLWDYMPINSHVRYLRKNKPDENFKPTELFRKGGFIIDKGLDKKTEMPYFKLSHNYVPGDKIKIAVANTSEHFVVRYDAIDTLYKKFSYENFVENYYIVKSLEIKQKQIKDLEVRVKSLEKTLDRRKK